MKCWTLYCHTHIESGRRYIGLTAQTWQQRWKNHINAAMQSKGGRWHFPNAIRKYGPDAFSHEVLEICYDLEVANLAEDCWIEFYETRNPEKGFNLAKGGSHTPHPEKRNPWLVPGFREKCIESLKVAARKPRAQAIRSAASKAAASRPEVKINRSLAQKAVMARPGQIEKCSQAIQDLWQSSNYRKKQLSRWDDHIFRIRSSSGLEKGIALNRAKTHCSHGHEYASENVRLTKTGSRVCVTCIRDRTRISQRRYREKLAKGQD